MRLILKGICGLPAAPASRIVSCSLHHNGMMRYSTGVPDYPDRHDNIELRDDSGNSKLTLKDIVNNVGYRDGAPNVLANDYVSADNNGSSSVTLMDVVHQLLTRNYPLPNPSDGAGEAKAHTEEKTNSMVSTIQDNSIQEPYKMLGIAEAANGNITRMAYDSKDETTTHLAQEGKDSTSNAASGRPTTHVNRYSMMNFVQDEAVQMKDKIFETAQGAKPETTYLAYDSEVKTSGLAQERKDNNYNATCDEPTSHENINNMVNLVQGKDIQASDIICETVQIPEDETTCIAYDGEAKTSGLAQERKNEAYHVDSRGATCREELGVRATSKDEEINALKTELDTIKKEQKERQKFMDKQMTRLLDNQTQMTRMMEQMLHARLHGESPIVYQSKDDPSTPIQPEESSS